MYTSTLKHRVFRHTSKRKRKITHYIGCLVKQEILSYLMFHYCNDVIRWAKQLTNMQFKIHVFTCHMVDTTINSIPQSKKWGANIPYIVKLWTHVFIRMPTHTHTIKYRIPCILMPAQTDRPQKSQKNIFLRNKCFSNSVPMKAAFKRTESSHQVCWL